MSAPVRRIGWHDPGCLKAGETGEGLFRCVNGQWRWYCCDGLVVVTTEPAGSAHLPQPFEGVTAVLPVAFEHRARPG